MAPNAALVLPLEVVGPVELGRLLRELERLDEALLQQELTKTATIKMPQTTQLLDRAIELNHLDMLQPIDRKRLIKFVTLIKEKAPVIRMSFSADPSPLFTNKIMTWLRREIHPQVLLSIGLQPNIGAGVIVRTPNKFYDFSLRQDMLKKSDLLLEKIREINAK